jgi:hypothetical protein
MRNVHVRSISKKGRKQKSSMIKDVAYGSDNETPDEERQEHKRKRDALGNSTVKACKLSRRTTRLSVRGHLLLTLPNELRPERIRWYVTNQGTKDFQPGTTTRQ